MPPVLLNPSRFGGGGTGSAYADAILADSPLAYYRLGDTPPIAAVTASSQFNTTTEAAANALDGTATTQWSTNGTATGWVRAELTAAAVVTSYKVAGRRDAFPNRSPSAWTFEGSNDGSTWTTLDTQSAITWTSGQVRTFSFANSTSYLYYRLNVSANTGDAYLNVPELTLVGVTDVTSLADTSGNGHSTNSPVGIWRVPGLLTGDPDGAGSFNGSTSVAYVSYGSWMNVAGDFTLDAVIKPNTISGTHAIISRDGGNAGARAWNLYQIGATLQMDNGTASHVNTGNVFTANTRYHIAMVYTAATTNIDLWLNGSLNTAGSVSVLGTLVGNDLVIGATRGGTNPGFFNPFSGILDEVAYYGTALSGARVAAHAALI